MSIFKKEWMLPKERKYYEMFADYYHVKYNIAKELQPKRIAEIGVRAGYSARSFLEAVPNASYFGFDANNGTHGGEGGEDGNYMAWAGRLLDSYDVTFTELDTQTVDTLNLFNIDIFHVDGDHTFDGAYHDLTLALKSISIDGYILVDDIKNIMDVKKAADKFIEDNNLNRRYVESLQGEYIISIPKG